MNLVLSTPPCKPLPYLEELQVGEIYDVGATRIEVADAIEFAQIFDPLSFHLDEGNDSRFNGLIISGAQSFATVVGMAVKSGFIDERTVVCGIGCDEMRFKKPVRPGELLSLTAQIEAVGDPRPGRDFGEVAVRYILVDEDGEVAVSMLTRIAIRSAAAAIRGPRGSVDGLEAPRATSAQSALSTSISRATR
jgi:acyl dehydratase